MTELLNASATVQAQNRTLSELVERICDYIDAADTPPTLAELSAHVHLSPYHLQRLFKRVMGISPRQYAAANQVGRLKARLRDGTPVTTALYESGYGSSSRLYEASDERIGMTPAAYRAGGAGTRIEYTICTVPMGRLLVGKTERGVCAVYLGDPHSDDELIAMLASEYPSARLISNENRLCQWVVTIIEHLNCWRPHLDLPLDLQATAFQERVWHELRRIPYGETRTYSQIAEAIGQPNAVRAVARACATNPVALLTPCHRVVRSDGTLGGYRWGLERKESLLAQERAHVGDPEPTTDAIPLERTWVQVLYVGDAAISAQLGEHLGTKGHVHHADDLMDALGMFVFYLPDIVVAQDVESPGVGADVYHHVSTLPDHVPILTVSHDTPVADTLAHVRTLLVVDEG